MFKRSTVSSVSALALLAFVAGSLPAAAADLPPPPPPPPVIKAAVVDWSGGYIGGVFGVACMDTYYIPSGAPDPDLNGCGFIGGFVGGYNKQFGDYVVGVEGDYMWGERTGQQTMDQVWYDIDSFATIRGRVGWLSHDNTLLYATAGVGWLEGTMDAVVGGVTPASDTFTHFGFVVGGGIEHAFSDKLHARIEYLYATLDDHNYDLSCGCQADLDFEHLHVLRAGFTYHFNYGYSASAHSSW